MAVMIALLRALGPSGVCGILSVGDSADGTRLDTVGVISVVKASLIIGAAVSVCGVSGDEGSISNLISTTTPI
jgi:hypothetical protein